MEKNRANAMNTRNFHRGLVLKTIEEKGIISRVEICKKVGLAAPTVSGIVKDFLDRGVVEEAGKGDSSGGKKPILLRINPKAGYVLAADLGYEDGIRVALMDLSNNIVRETSGPPMEILRGGELGEILSMIVCELLQKENISEKKVLGVCIGVPGIIDFNSGKVTTVTPYLNQEILLEDLELKEINTPYVVENDVNLMALGERAKGIAEGVDDFVFVGERLGIGAGIVINGKLHTGVNNAAGEVGYFLIDREYVAIQEKSLEAGWCGCFERLAGHKAITKKAKELMGRPMKAVDIFRAAGKGNVAASEIVKETLEYLACGISNICCVLDPELVVIGGRISTLPEDFLEKIKTQISSIIPFIPRIEFSRLDEDGVLIGGAVKVLEPLKTEGLVCVE